MKSRFSNIKKVELNGIEFDSREEARYYVHLENDPLVEEIELNPEYEIIPNYEVECNRCWGNGRVPSPKTGNPVNCKRCKGRGAITKKGAIYTADFKVLYTDGSREVVDVKGNMRPSRDFSLRKKLFETMTGQELIVVKWDKKTKQWKKG